jgi:hypothetical protein
VAAWRRQPGHPLKWDLVAGKFIRYRAGDLKRYMATPAKRRAHATATLVHRRTDDGRGYANLSFLYCAAEYTNRSDLHISPGDFDPSGVRSGEKIEERRIPNAFVMMSACVPQTPPLRAAPQT